MMIDEPELVRWGERIGAHIQAPVWVVLTGPVGAGKSVLARAVVRGAGITEVVPSPTFNLVFRYRAPRGIHIVHLDLYRLERPEDLWEIGWEELGAPDEVVLIEWPERAGDLLPADRWEVALEVADGDATRRSVEVTRVGDPGFLPGFPVSLSLGGEE
ncbi:MAG: tRNA (adenosine(37)-N6)-threonylcarbamoyltransferase complex ATPase subunit type 1 TsaE [Gemmatimonadota bacterium]|nr:MAG: tRNA (adenosine(37)-N6)-threonylcarbamoyltransferase complex ATPase subunit type 1 TsaE [Gemmatimonadota bacterium]